MFSLMYEYQVSWPPHPSPLPRGGEGFVVSSAERMGRGSTIFLSICEIANSSRDKRGDGPRVV